MKPVVCLHATLQYCHAMLVFWLAVCSKQVASSNVNLLVKVGCFRYCCNTLKTGKYASFYVQNPITDFTELLERVRKAVPVLKGIPDDQIRISYKDVQLGTFVNIDSHEQLHLQETFRNAFPCGSDSYRRVHLKVRESDSPFLLKSSRSSQPLPQETEHTKPSVAKLKLQPKTLFTPSDDCHESELASTFNWKDSKKEQLF